MKTLNYLLVLTTFCCFAFASNAQKASNKLNKEKFNLNTEVENEIGYTQAVKIGNTIYISGSVGWGHMTEAIDLAYKAIEKTLANYELSFDNVVKENLYSTQLDSVIKYKDLRKEFYNNDYPAATWVQVDRLYNEGIVLEVEVIAYTE